MPVISNTKGKSIVNESFGQILATLAVPAMLTNASALLLLGATNRHGVAVRALKAGRAHRDFHLRFSEKLLFGGMLALQLAAMIFGAITGVVLFAAYLNERGTQSVLIQESAMWANGVGLVCLTGGVALLAADFLWPFFPSTSKSNRS